MWIRNTKCQAFYRGLYFVFPDIECISWASITNSPRNHESTPSVRSYDFRQDVGMADRDLPSGWVMNCMSLGRLDLWSLGFLINENSDDEDVFFAALCCRLNLLLSLVTKWCPALLPSGLWPVRFLSP